MEQKFDDFYRSLQRGPAFLLLGQAYLGAETGVDPFLSELLRKFGATSDISSHYRALLESEAGISPEASLAWMDELCRRISTPDWLKTVASYSWSGVYASAIDSVWPTEFRTSWRDVYPLFEEKYKPENPRNRLVLHLTFLYGCVNRSDEAERPPLVPFELTKRRQVALGLARRLSEEVTPFGTLVVDGYAGNADWLTLDDLLPIVDALNTGQTHIFSATHGLLTHPDIKYLTEKGKLTLHEEGLAQVLSRGHELGFLRLGVAPDREESGRRIAIEDKVLAVPREIWNQVSRSATVVDDSMLVEPPSLSDDARYREFRRFLSESALRPLWSGYARGFAYTRRYGKILFSRTEFRLKQTTLNDEPTILHGQTGTGKTVALAELAYQIRKLSKYPVLFIERKTQRPLAADIDHFCQWAEDNGAPSCLVIWDGMLDPREYSEFLRILTSRGRKIVLVGSSYRQSRQYARGDRFVEAPARLSQEETNEFTRFLSGFLPSIDQRLGSALVAHDESYLAALYRLLPPTRSLIRSGVSREIGHAEQAFAQVARSVSQYHRNMGTLAYALAEAGIIGQESSLLENTTLVDGEHITGFQDLIGLIMVPGRFGLNVPIELLLRAWGKGAVLDFLQLFENVDVLRWYEDSQGRVMVAPRNPLEAQIVVQTRLGGPRTEVAFIKKLLTEVHDDRESSSQNAEVEFAVSILRAVGAQGRNNAYFAPHFRDLADSLQELRTNRGIKNPRIMLQEANLLRATALRLGRNGEQEEERKILEGVEELLRQALNLFDGDRRTASLRAAIMNELATTLGSQAKNMIASNQPAEAARFFQSAREATHEARLLDPANYYPIDVLSWVTRDLLASDMLDERSRTEAIADLLNVFQTTEIHDLDDNQLERFNSRRVEFGDLLGDKHLSEEAFAQLIGQGSCAGFYLRASRMAGNFRTRNKLTDENFKNIRTALSYLEEKRQEVSGDARCLELFLDLSWMLHTRTRLFEGERQTPPLNQVQWRQFLQAIHDLEATGQSHRGVALEFLRGLCLFHLNEVEEAIQVFRDVEIGADQVYGRRRVVRSYLASTQDGQPRTFHGTVRWISENERRGEVYVEELRRHLLFLPREFGRPGISHGEPLGDFHIAFNFLGPIADPLTHYVT